jgi:hypothetical protein
MTAFPTKVVPNLLCVCCIAALVVLTLVPVQSAAQVLYGQLVGNVTDASKAVIPGAAVTATNVNTNQTKETLANDAGQYIFREL